MTTKHSIEYKISLVRSFLGELPYARTEAYAKMADIHPSTMRKWIRKYRKKAMTNLNEDTATEPSEKVEKSFHQLMMESRDKQKGLRIEVQHEIERLKKENTKLRAVIRTLSELILSD